MKLVYLFFLFCCVHFTFAQDSNFSGRWGLNTSKSEFGQAPLFVVPMQIDVKHTRDSISLVIINLNEDGKTSTASASYPLDGKVQERQIGGITLIGSFQWSTDKRQLTKNQSYINSAQNIEPYRKIKEVWRLSEDGKLLTVAQTVEAINFDPYTVKAVYEKRVLGSQ